MISYLSACSVGNKLEASGDNEMLPPDREAKTIAIQ
jgi:hypothetical protein